MNDISDNLEFDNLVKDKGDRALLEFVARQTYETNKRCEVHDQRLCALENIQTASNKQVVGVGSLSGGITGLLGGVIVFLIEYFRTKSSG